MSNKQKIKAFLKYIESQNKHKRLTLMVKMQQLDLDKTQTWRDIKEGSASIGKNTLKGLILYNLVDAMED